jgi:RNA polymerase sigma factor (sigma-70 family)
MTKPNSYYLREIEKISLLTVEEEKALATKASSGDKLAKKKLVEANLRFVVKIANEYLGYMDIEDLINEGNLGLMHAAEKFNPSTGNKFITYAVWWIRAYIQKAIRETSTGIKFPSHKFDEMKKSKWKLARLDKAVGNDEEKATLADFIVDERIMNPEESFLIHQTELELKQFIKELKPNEKAVIIKRYGLDGKDPMTLSEIGSILGFSKERIRQLESRALNQLKKNLTYSNYYVDLVA